MSEPFDEAIEKYDPGRGDDHSHQSSPDQESHPKSNLVDGGPIFSMYLKKAEEEDKRTAEGWKEEAEKVFLFTGLFSAVVATFISMSIQGIQANPQDTSNFYLASIHQALTNPNTPNISLPSSPPPFSPPTYGIWVNSLWFLSLAISMTCAVLANLLQQWARKYLRVTRPRPTASEPKRARSHAFYADGVEDFLLPWVFEALPAMLHLSVFLFFAGLVVFLWHIDATISKLMLSWVAGCVILYGYITFIPTFRHDSPYHTPLSPLAWSIVTGIPFLTFRILKWIARLVNVVLLIIFWFLMVTICCPCLFCFRRRRLPFHDRRVTIDRNRLAEAAERHRKKLVEGLQKTAEKAALNLQSGLSRRALMRTFDSLHEDHELEHFFSSLPGFRGSNGDDDILSRLSEDQKENLWTGLIGFLDRTFSSDLLHESVKNRRAKICAVALDPAAFPYIIDSVISEDHYGPVRSARIAHVVRRWDNGKNEATPMLVRALVSSVVATTQLRNDDWFAIASDELGVAETVLRNYSTHDLSLAILIHVTRQQLSHVEQPSWPSDQFAKVLRATSNFEVQQSSPELKRGFCALWNQILERAQNAPNENEIAQFILRPIYKVHDVIHQQTPAHASPRTRLFARTADILKSTREYSSCDREDYQFASPPHFPPLDRDDSMAVTFANIATLAHPTSETSPSALPFVTTAPRASPAMTYSLDPSASAKDKVNDVV